MLISSVTRNSSRCALKLNNESGGVSSQIVSRELHMAKQLESFSVVDTPIKNARLQA